jgi:putative chitinase
MHPIDIVRAHCPRAHPNYVAAFQTGEPDLVAAGIITRLRLAHFLAQAFHETGDLTILVESMSYSAARMCQVWPRRFPTISSASPYEHNEQALAERVYGGRMGNGPEGDGDGWRYIGRGLVQCTGRESYERFGRLLQIDLAENPSLAIDPRWTLRIALAEWAQKGCNLLADRNDLVGISRAINGGTIGLSDRRDEFDGLWPLMLREREETFTATWAATAAPGETGEAWAVARPSPTTADLQRALNHLLGLSLDVDGQAGPATRAAVKQFQAAHGLDIDGLAGSATWAAIHAAGE